MNRILFATDLTERSRPAGERARRLQVEFDAQLTALHVVDADLPASLRRHHTQEAEKAILASFDAAPDGTLPDGRRLRVSIVAGVEHEEIAAAAQEHDLLVVGTHRRSLRDCFVGTTVERVLRVAERPVLVVKDSPVQSYGRVAVAVDLSEAARRVAAAAAWLAPEANFSLVHIHEGAYSGYMTEDAARHAGQDPDVNAALDAIETALPQGAERRLIRLGDPVPGIRAAASELGADLIVLATRGRGGLSRALLGSVAERVLADPVCDILVAQARNPHTTGAG